MKINKKKKIAIIISVLIVIIALIAIITYIVNKPKIELNKAISYIKEGEYKKAYNYINSTSNEKNKRIVKEILTEIFNYKMADGLDELTTIFTEGTNIIYKVDLTNIDYSLDDNLTVRVENLQEYIKLRDQFSKEMLIEEMDESYDMYFEIAEYINLNFKDFLNRFLDETFTAEIQDIASDLYTLSIKLNNIGDIYEYLPETQDIWEEIEKYV